MSFIPYDDRDGFIWIDGEFRPWREANVHVLTHGMHYASTVFEGERAYTGEIYRSEHHSQRLENSAHILGFELPYSVAEIEDAKREALAKSGLENAYVRAFAWRGSEQMGILATETSVRVAIACWSWGDYFDNKMEGIRLTNAAYARPSPETAPCHAKAAGLYMICTISKQKAHLEGYADALMLDHKGDVAEATGAKPRSVLPRPARWKSSNAQSRLMNCPHSMNASSPVPPPRSHPSRKSPSTATPRPMSARL